MAPCCEPSLKNLKTPCSSFTKDLVSYLWDVVISQATSSSSNLTLDTRITYPKYGGKMDGEMLDSWIQFFCAYVKTKFDMKKAMRL
jgi:hypothetical protein